MNVMTSPHKYQAANQEWTRMWH